MPRWTGAGNWEMRNGSYIPDKGDIVWLTFNPQAGREQKGRRPALCLSPKIYNEKTNLGIFCPITTKIKGYPFEVLIPEKCKTKGVILADQVRSLDWFVRKAEFIEKCPEETLEEVIEKIKILILS